jgi:hypothetical protein
LLLSLLTVACSSSPSAAPDTGSSANEPVRYSGVLAATEFLVGENRFPFGLITVAGEELRDVAVSVRFYSLSSEQPKPRGEHSAQWREVVGNTPHLHDDGAMHQHHDVRGVYIVEGLSLNEPGIWIAEFIASAEDGTPFVIQNLAFPVIADSPAPEVGEQVPPTENPTIHDVEEFSNISTRLVEDELHEYSVAEALNLNRPFVVLFSSPQFCVSAMCGPVTDVTAQVHSHFRDRVNMIHIEPWDLDTARNQGRLVRSKGMTEWGLPSEPWLFVVRADGTVAERFEGLVSGPELERSLQDVLAD